MRGPASSGVWAKCTTRRLHGLIVDDGVGNMQMLRRLAAREYYVPEEPCLPQVAGVHVLGEFRGGGSPFGGP